MQEEPATSARLNPYANHLHLAQPLIDFATAAHEGLDPTLVQLVEIRASQINGCAGCLILHTRKARQQGETEERIYLLNAWREAPHYSERERAALAWTEAITSIQPAGVPDAIYDAFAAHFSEEEQAKITLVIGAINVFNRMNVGFAVRPRMTSSRAEA